jgi:hypothetical protein
MWCAKYDPGHGPKMERYNSFCKQYGSSTTPAIQEGAGQAADSILSAANGAGLNWDNLTWVAIAGIGILALVVMIR